MALVLSRKAGEEILIGDDICIRVGEIRGDKVRLLIEAPREVAVHRREIREAILAGRCPDCGGDGAGNRGQR